MILAAAVAAAPGGGLLTEMVGSVGVGGSVGCWRSVYFEEEETKERSRTEGSREEGGLNAYRSLASSREIMREGDGSDGV
jgi:hypothetical protein